MMDKTTYLKDNGIDISIGMSYLGDEAMYNEILLDFKNGFVAQMNEIKKSYESADYGNYTILVHALKSNCKTLGITSLADLAYSHEMAGKANDWDFIHSHINDLFLKANEIYKILEQYFTM